MNSASTAAKKAGSNHETGIENKSVGDSESSNPVSLKDHNLNAKGKAMDKQTADDMQLDIEAILTASALIKTAHEVLEKQKKRNPAHT